MVLAANNEESRIAARIRELVSLVAAHPAGGEVVVVSDGSIDHTVEEARAAATGAELSTHGRVPVRVLVQDRKLGKAMALNRAHAAPHPILVFADARQTWLPKHSTGWWPRSTTPRLVPSAAIWWSSRAWRDEGGRTVLAVREVAAADRKPARFNGQRHGLHRGRAAAFRTLPAGTILDDVYWPLAVAMAGHRVVHEEPPGRSTDCPSGAMNSAARCGPSPGISS